MKFTITFRSKSLLITATLILGLSIQAMAAAGNHRTNKTNESYYSISKIPEVLFNRKPKQHDAAYAISPDAVLYKLKQKQKITLIDVRNPEEFERMRIPGSLNIPLYAVKTKVFLKSFAVVLINEGVNYSPLETECRHLTDLGFKAFVLDGGLPAWKRKGNRLAGDLFALEEMRVISPQVFFQEKDYENTLVVDISPVQTEASRKLMPYSKHLPVSADPREWARNVDQIITSHKNQPFLSILVFNEAGDGYTSVYKILANAAANAFCLQGGVAGYNRYLGDLMLSWRPRNIRIKTNRKCGTCAKEIEKNIITEIRR